VFGFQQIGQGRRLMLRIDASIQSSRDGAPRIAFGRSRAICGKLQGVEI
jgi:hypothetical protein